MVECVCGLTRGCEVVLGAGLGCGKAGGGGRVKKSWESV